MRNEENIGNIPSYVKSNVTKAAIISKLNKEDTPPVNMLNKLGDVEKISKFTKDRLGNNETILRLFPEIELSIQILTSSILSPNDMLTTNIIYNTQDIRLPSELTNTLSSIVKTYMDKTYKLQDELPTILREALFTKGAFIKAIIPESILDEIINASQYENLSMEDMQVMMGKESKNYLGDANDKISIEGYDDISIDKNETDVEITDNLSYLKLKDLVVNNIEDKLNKGLGIESVNQEYNNLFKINLNNNNNNNSGEENKFSMIRLGDERDAFRQSVTQPLIIKLPVESAVPVHVKGDPKNHLGYFILLDEYGVPIDGDTSVSSGDKSKRSGILAKAEDALKGLSKKAPTIEKLEELYSEIIDDQIKSKIKSGVFGDIADVTELHDIYRTMFNRSLKNKKSKLLFLPANLVSFYAFKYRSNGTGESLIETISTIASMRAILLFTRLMATIKNSITTTNVDVDLDEHDPDPEKTKEVIISEVLKNRQLELPVGISSLDDLVDWSHSVGFTFNFKHISLPDMTVTVDHENTSVAVPDDELETSLREQMIKAFGLSPELVDNSSEADFATSVVANNILMAKRVLQLQSEFTPQLTNNVKKILRTDATAKALIKDVVAGSLPLIKKTIRKINKESFDKLEDGNDMELVEYITNYYIENIELKLPKPEMTNNDNMTEAFNMYKDSIDGMIDSIISDEALPEDLIGDISEHLDGFKDMLKNTLIRQWSSDNNYLPELFKAFTIDEEGKPVLDIVTDFDGYKNNLTLSLINYIKKNNKDTSKFNDKLEKILNDEDDDEGATDVTPEETSGGEEPIEGETPEGGNEDIPDEGEEIDDPNIGEDA